VPKRTDAQLLQVLRGQVRQDRVVYLVLAESRLIPFEAELPQSIPEVHRGVALSRSKHLYLLHSSGRCRSPRPAAIGLRSPLMKAKATKWTGS
jgi:hypothetical protein